VAGEITPAYSALDRDRVAHIHNLMPDAKIVFFMRNPIERAWSQTVMSFDKAEKGSASSATEKALFRKIKRDSTWKLSNFLRTFENWGEFYPDDQIFVGFLEDISFFPGELLSSLYGFLGVDPSFEPPLTNKKVHTRSAGTMPTKVAVHLAQNFHAEITRLHERFEGYASFWLHCADRLIEDSSGEKHMAYPLYQSYLWKEWTEASAIDYRGIQSGPLASIQVAT